MKKQLVTPTLTPLGQAPPTLVAADAEEADKNRSITAKAKTVGGRARFIGVPSQYECPSKWA